MRTLEQEESPEMHIARDQSYKIHGAFLEHFLIAFLNSDSQNFDLLQPAMRALIRKYHLACTCKDSPIKTRGWVEPA